MSIKFLTIVKKSITITELFWFSIVCLWLCIFLFLSVMYSINDVYQLACKQNKFSLLDDNKLNWIAIELPLVLVHLICSFMFMIYGLIEWRRVGNWRKCIQDCERAKRESRVFILHLCWKHTILLKSQYTYTLLINHCLSVQYVHDCVRDTRDNYGLVHYTD